MDRFNVGSRITLEVFSPISSECQTYTAMVISVHGNGEYTVEWPSHRYATISMRAHEHDGARSKADLVAGKLAPPKAPKPTDNPIGVDPEHLEKAARDQALLTEKFLEMAAATYRCPKCTRELKGSMARIYIRGARSGELVDLSRLLTATELRCPDKKCGGILVRTSLKKTTPPLYFHPAWGKKN